MKEMPLDNVLFLTPIFLYLGSIVAVVIFVHSKAEDKEYFFAGRTIGSFQAVLSVVATETSVATTVIFPAAGLAGGYVLIWMLLGYITGRTIVALFYLRALYDSNRLTIYQTMSGSHRFLESTYLLAKYISGGARYFIAGFALQQILGGHAIVWILAVAACGGAYSLMYLLRAVVIMDQIQSVLIVGTGVFLCFFLAYTLPTANMTAPAFYDLNPANYTFSPILFIAGTVLSIGSHGADQDLLLRILATKSFPKARRSLILSGFAAAFLITIYLTIGYLLRNASVSSLDPKSPLADFVIKANLPLLRGIFLVLLSAAAMSSLDSTIHATGAIWKSLTRSQLPGRYWSAFSLGVMICFAVFFMRISEHYKDFLALCMGSMNYVNGGLIAIATVFTFFRDRITPAGVMGALIAGFANTSVCEWAFAKPVPWTYTLLISVSLAFAVCMLYGTLGKRSGST